MSFILSLLGFGRMLREWAGIAFKWALANPLLAGIAALAVVAFWQHHEAVKWETAFEKQRAGYIAAQAEAQAKQTAADLATEARYSALARESEHEHLIAVQSVQSAADRYAMSHRVRPCPAAGSATSPGLAGMPTDPASPGDTSGSADWIAVAPEDYRKFTDATLQAAERGNFLQSLISSGYAVLGD